MRNYFWIKEHSRGNVYADSQEMGLQERTLLLRNDSVRSSPPHLNAEYPDKAFILHEFKNYNTYWSERNCLVNQMSKGAGWYALEPSLRTAIDEAQTHVSNGYRVAIVASASMLNKTLIHYNSKPVLQDKPCGDEDYYDCNSHRLLLSNGEKIKRCVTEERCGAIFYHPFAFDYGYKVAPKEGLKASAGRCWVGLTRGSRTGNIAWKVNAEDGYGFVDFANFGCANRCQGFPQYGSSEQEKRLEGSDYGLPVYKPASCKEEVALYTCTRWDGCTCIGVFSSAKPTCKDTSQMYFYAPVSGIGQQQYLPYYDFLDILSCDCAHARTRLFRAQTIVDFSPSVMGVYTPYYRNFAREVCGKSWAGDFPAMHSWLKQNTTNGSCGGRCGAYEKMMASAGKVLGIYGSTDIAFCGKPVGAVVHLRTDGTCFVFNEDVSRYCTRYIDYGGGTLPYAGIGENCALIGDFTEGNADGLPTVGYRSPNNETALNEGNPPRNVVTLNSRQDVEARLNLEVICATMWDVVARIRFRLDASENWEEFTAEELWTQFQSCMHDQLPVFCNAGYVPYTIEEAGISDLAYFSSGTCYFTLYELAVACGLEPSQNNIGEVYELLTAGLTVAFEGNEMRTDTPPWANISYIGVSPHFNDKPCINCFC